MHGAPCRDGVPPALGGGDHLLLQYHRKVDQFIIRPSDEGAAATVASGVAAGEVEGLADRLSWIDAEMLSANKRIINIGMELMGAQTLQRLAAENDARAHTTQAAKNVFKQIAAEGLRAALDDRDRPFGDSRAKVIGPEIRDNDGFLIGTEE